MTPIIAANWLNISINLLLVIHVIICLLLALVVLMQRPKQEGLGAAFGGGLTDQAFGARTTDVLQKGTIYLGTLFFIVTLILAILIGKRQSNSPKITADVAGPTEELAAPEDKAPAPPAGDEQAPVEMPETNNDKAGQAPAAEQTQAVEETPAAAGEPAPPVEQGEPAEDGKPGTGENEPAEGAQPAAGGQAQPAAEEPAPPAAKP